MPNPPTLLEQIAEIERYYPAHALTDHSRGEPVVPGCIRCTLTAACAKLREMVEAAQRVCGPHLISEDGRRLLAGQVAKLTNTLTPMPKV